MIVQITFKSSCIRKYNKKSGKFDINCGVNWDLVNQTVEIILYLNNELINKDIKHNLLTNLIICANMAKVIDKAEYRVGSVHSPSVYISDIIGGKLVYFKIVKCYYHSKIIEYVQSMAKIKQW